ncbi:MAG: DUF1553 domain-containing protein [Cyclobacteriaceae bacterium]
MMRFLVLLLSISILYSCGEKLPEDVKLASMDLPQVIDYNFHVKPILSDKCFACHGPDAAKQKAELRLDIEEEAYNALASGNGHAIKPGNTRNSLLVSKILSEDPEVMMPPSESNLELSADEKAVLIKWIEQGAKYKPHWAFMKPEKVPVPETGGDWAKNEIDHFVLDKLEQKNLSPSPEAEREHLIRRLFFDITGLPPTIEDLDYWLAYDEETYYDILVDSLLNKPAFGERMAAHWLDVARFADSEGYLDDFHHTFWPYRDWVIKAFNENLSYDKFILWQIGGDQLPNPTTEQILATAFNRNHKQNSEGGIIPEEFRVEYVADRTNTVGSAFMALTVGCARCHDHKYDPFSQKNYYELFSFFNSTIERGDGIFSYNAIENGQMVPNKYSMNSGPVVPLLEEEAEEIRDYLLSNIKEEEQGLKSAEKANDVGFKNWLSTTPSVDPKKVVDKSTLIHLTFDDMKDGKASDQVKRNEPARYGGSIGVAEGKFGKAVVSAADGQFVADGKPALFERVDDYTISFWINSNKSYKNAHVLYNGNNRIQGYRGWDVVIKEDKLHFRLNHAHPYQSIDIRDPETLNIGEWIHYVWTYDGSSKAEGMKLYRNGKKVAFDTVRDYIYRSAKPYTNKDATVYMTYTGMIIGKRHYDKDFTGGMLDEVRILNHEVDDFTALYLYDKESGMAVFNEAFNTKSVALNEFYDLHVDKTLANKRKQLADLRLKEVFLVDTAQEVMVMGDFPEKRPTYILERGVYDEHGEEVTSDVPEAILEMPEDLPRNRLGLGKWLIHPDNPLTSRVAVNQMWYLMFGRGIVETVEDFGNQGALPTHPELLDWLAVDFQEHGWDLKRLIKQMVTSATYRQSSRIRPDLQEEDPGNYLLARGPRYRLSAEMVRDNILAASGLLVEQQGGISVFPYQPQGLWKEVMTHGFFPEYEEDPENGLYRRSIYTFWKRNMPPPNMLIFDASSRAECQVRRQRSNTPLQALVLMNDPQFVEGCRVLAENAWTGSAGDLDTSLEHVFRSLTSRAPSNEEMEILTQQFKAEKQYFESNPDRMYTYLNTGYRPLAQKVEPLPIAALSRVTNTILNTTEAYFKN